MLINKDQYKTLMESIEQLANRVFVASDLDRKLNDFLGTRLNIESNEITRTGQHTQAAIGAIAQANEKLRLELAVIYDNKLANATITSSVLTLGLSVIGLDFAANERNNESNNSNNTLIATTLLSSLATSVSYFADYSKNAEKLELSRSHPSEKLRKLAKDLYVDLNRNELDKLINNLSPQDRDKNEVRIIKLLEKVLWLGLT